MTSELTDKINAALDEFTADAENKNKFNGRYSARELARQFFSAYPELIPVCDEEAREYVCRQMGWML